MFKDFLVFCVGGVFLVMLVVYMMKEKWKGRLEKNFGVIDDIFLDKKIAKQS